MPFELETITKLKITDVVVLSQKNRQPDDNPGVKISIECAMPNYALTHFDGALRGALFQKKPGTVASGQQSLDGIQAISDLASKPSATCLTCRRSARSLAGSTGTPRARATR